MNSEPILFHVNLLLLSCLSLPLFYLVRSSVFRSSLLIVLGGYLVFLAAPHLILFWVLYWIAIWAVNLILGSVKGDRIRAVVFWTALVAALMPMVGWKLLDTFFLQLLNGGFQSAFKTIVPSYGANRPVSNLLVPIGLSFSTFRAIDLLVCRYLDVVSRQSILNTLFFGFFPPIQLMGPIAQSSELLQTAGGRPVEPDPAVSENIAYGSGRILIGLFKIYILALPLSGSGDFIARYQTLSLGELWLHLLSHAWYFYLNFAGFSDLAIGGARLYGYRIGENFSYPYFQRNLQQFWAHWHMSLTSFAQRNIFVPLGGFRRHRQYEATFATMMVIALWHDLTFRLVVFGIAHALVLMGLRYVQSRPDFQNKRVPAPVGILATHVFVVATVPLISMERLDIMEFYRYLLTFGLM